ncbi:unnamed protein product [Mytilus edulis]|uniref:PiggyBac transposable element-derived protein domain-containing protein n=1 Tax=Mytilus edulis TaxID=6550 RepID=A0A8S3S5C7_MYTED|nr:unnamed protein product [Mytilus edulis]
MTSTGALRNMANMANPWFRIFPPEEIAEDPEFIGESGVKNMPDRGAPAIAYFMLMFTVNLMKKIVLETNRYARSFIKTNMQRINRCRHSRVHQWIKTGPLTINEFKGFLAAIYNMGLNKRPTLQCYWKKGKQEYKWFRKMFPRNRFQLILKFLHVVDNRKVSGRNDPTYDPSAKFKPILDSLNMRSKYLYTPERNLSIDESLVGTRARSVMTQYIPSKSHKFGIKLWMLVESISGYLIHSTVYRGRRFDPVPDGELQSSMVVKSLLNVSCLFDKGYHVFCDSFFSSLSLASELLLNRTFMTGTLRSNRPMPQRIKTQNYVRMNIQNKRKPVRLVSTFCKARVSPRGKPTAIESYSKNMGGVDRNDMFTAFYNDERKTVKMWKKIMFNLFQRFMINAYILYKKNSNNPRPLSRLQFIHEVVESLSMEHMRDRFPGQLENRKKELRRLANGKVKDCVVCSYRSNGRRKRSRLQCGRCLRGVHSLCFNRHLVLCDEQ